MLMMYAKAPKIKEVHQRIINMSKRLDVAQPKEQINKSIDAIRTSIFIN